MTDGDKKLLSILEARVQQLMFLHDELCKQNESLQQRLDTLTQEQEDLKQKYQDLENNYTDLKQARIINIRNADVDETKQRLSKLVREIDKCLNLLNG